MRTLGTALVLLAAVTSGCTATPAEPDATAGLDAPPATVACGAERCAADEYCVIPCSGTDAGVPLPPPQCRPLPSAACAAGDPCGCFCAGATGGADTCRIFYDEAVREIRCPCA